MAWHETSFYPSISLLQWNLTCERAYMARLSTTIYFIGVLTGGLIVGTVADRFGRRLVMLVSLYCPIVVGVAIALSTNFVMFTCLRFVQGLLMQVRIRLDKPPWIFHAGIHTLLHVFNTCPRRKRKGILFLCLSKSANIFVEWICFGLDWWYSRFIFTYTCFGILVTLTLLAVMLNIISYLNLQSLSHSRLKITRAKPQAKNCLSYERCLV